MNTIQPDSTQSGTSEVRNECLYQTQSCGWGWCSFGAFIGLAGGIVSVLLGCALTAATWITGAERSGDHMHTLGDDFLFLTIPLLILGGVCLDLEDKRKGK